MALMRDYSGHTIDSDKYTFVFSDMQKAKQFLDHVQKGGYKGSFDFDTIPYRIDVQLKDQTQYHDLDDYFYSLSDSSHDAMYRAYDHTYWLTESGERKINSTYTKNESGRYTHNSSYTPPENAVDMTGETGAYNPGSNSGGYIKESDKYKKR